MSGVTYSLVGNVFRLLCNGSKDNALGTFQLVLVGFGNGGDPCFACVYNNRLGKS